MYFIAVGGLLKVRGATTIQRTSDYDTGDYKRPLYLLEKYNDNCTVISTHGPPSIAAHFRHPHGHKCVEPYVPFSKDLDL